LQLLINCSNITISNDNQSTFPFKKTIGTSVVVMSKTTSSSSISIQRELILVPRPFQMPIKVKRHFKCVRL
jgi:hypothetical protein